MKFLPVIVFIFFVQCAIGQPDTLLNRSFNDRYPVLLNILDKPFNDRDSATFYTVISNLRLLAQQHRDKKLLAELECIEFRWLCEKQKTLGTNQIERAFQHAFENAQKLDYIQVEATVEFERASYYWEMQNFPLSVQYFEKALDLVRDVPASEYYLKQEINYQIALKYYYFTDYHTSIYYLRQASADSSAQNRQNPPISIYNTLGLAYLNLEKLDTAELYFRKALDYAYKANSKVWIGNLSGNIGHVYIERGDLEKGEAMLRIDKDMCISVGAKNPAMGAYLELASLSIQKGNFAEAQKLVDSALLIVKGRVSFGRKRSLFPLLSKLYGYKGDWLKSAAYLDSTLMVTDSLARLNNAEQVLRLKQQVELQVSKAEIARREASIRQKDQQLFAVFAGLLLALVAGFLIFRQKNRADKAKKRSDELLLNILPKDIAEELKSAGVSPARQYLETTILFCDFINFTRYSEELKPAELVRILDAYFSAFDALVAEFGLEKIKTVGDAYLCVCGLPTSDPLHAEKTVRCALGIQHVMKTSAAGWQLRIGIHTGPVVAGIVGVKKFAYDIWGDTVNTAARMEQNCEAGKVNISQATYELVKDKFTCVHRGKVGAKNKGALDMYFVEGD